MNSVRTTNRYLDRTSNYSQSNSGRLSPVSSVQSEVSADSDDNRSVSIDFRSRAGSQEDGMYFISFYNRFMETELFLKLFLRYATSDIS